MQREMHAGLCTLAKTQISREVLYVIYHYFSQIIFCSTEKWRIGWYSPKRKKVYYFQSRLELGTEFI
jgi:hypothetical protein